MRRDTFIKSMAVKLGPPEYFMLMLLAFTTVSAVLGQSAVRGLTALFVGLAAGLVGLDQITGQARYTGGVPELLGGTEIPTFLSYAVEKKLAKGSYQAALVLAGMILGPLAEAQLRNAMSIGEGGAMVFVQRPMSLALLVVVLSVLVVPRFLKMRSTELA